MEGLGSNHIWSKEGEGSSNSFDQELFSSINTPFPSLPLFEESNNNEDKTNVLANTVNLYISKTKYLSKTIYDQLPTGTPKALTLREQFRNFSKFGDTKSDGKMITLSQADKWFKQAKVIDGKTITTTDTAITFNRFKTKKIAFPDFEKYLDEIAKSKKLEAKDIKTKLKECGAPGTSGTTNVVKSSAVDRLTDTKKFTGSHKLRFDSAGRGKGISGRKDTPDTSGYVAGYKNKNTYDKSH